MLYKLRYTYYLLRNEQGGSTSDIKIAYKLRITGEIVSSGIAANEI